MARTLDGPKGIVGKRIDLKVASKKHMNFKLPLRSIAPVHQRQWYSSLLDFLNNGREGGIQARVISRRLSSTVVWKPA